MAKISVSKTNQATVTIPTEIMEVMGWSDKTNIYFMPLLQNANDPITKDTAIIIKEIKDIKNVR